MGVSGSGKTSVGRLLAERLGLSYVEGDKEHPQANLKKMAAGIALNDEDRRVWLQRLEARLAAARAAGSGMVMACSALKRKYRDTLRAGDPDVFFVYLHGSHALLEERLKHRRGHFMPPSLLDSQLADLEPLQEDESGMQVDVGPTLEEIVGEILRRG